jgi:hypothetical protein|tara:strand:- start:952 stop:1137 length:186 start_codon:yes stop_codon:yes gene_type:complete
LGEIIILKSFLPQYIVSLSFDSATAWYGNKSEQVLTQVITSHQKVITVVKNNIVSPIIDNQ